MANRISNSVVFLHQSAAGNRTLTFSAGNLNVTVFDGDMDPGVSEFIAKNLDPQLKTSAKGTPFYQTTGKLHLEWQPQGNPEVREDGTLSISGYLVKASPAAATLATGAFGKFVFPTAPQTPATAPQTVPAGLTPEQLAAIQALGIKLG